MNKGYRVLDDTKIMEDELSDQRKKLTQPPLEDSYEGTLISLPNPLAVEIKSIDLKEAILSRRSIRKYQDEPLTLNALSYALYMTQGIKEMGPKHTLRTVPSAGARHAFETLLYVNNIVGLAPGLYQYVASKHGLVLLHQNDLTEALLEATFHQTMVVSSAVTFFYVADTYRMEYRYQSRGYRYLFLDAGHVMQNLYLIASQLDAATCAIGAYDDDKINALFNLDGYKKAVLYIAPLGKK